MVGPSRTRRTRVEYRSGCGDLVETTLAEVVVEDVTAGLPVREFRVYKGRKHYSGWYWSSTMSRLLAYESRLELARIMLADFDPELAAIAAQPLRLIGPDGARIRRHVPDLLLVDRDGGVRLVDVKSRDRVERPENREVFAWTEETIAGRGWAFEVWSQAPLPLLTNIRFLAGYRREALIEASLIPDVLALARPPAAIIDVERALAVRPTALVRPVILHLIWMGELEADLMRPLSRESIVSAGGVGA
jgi:hypothetical protein